MPTRKKNSERASPPHVEFVQHYHRKMVEPAGSLIERLLPKSIHAVTVAIWVLIVVATTTAGYAADREKPKLVLQITVDQEPNPAQFSP